MQLNTLAGRSYNDITQVPFSHGEGLRGITCLHDQFPFGFAVSCVPLDHF